MSEKIAIIGVGRMGKALIEGYIETQKSLGAEKNILKDWVLITPRQKPYIKGYVDRGASCFPKLTKEIAKQLDIILLAVKPKHMRKLGEEIAPVLSPSNLIISVIAGISLGTYERLFGQEIPVIRAMPNTPAEIRQGVTVITPNTVCNKDQIKKAEGLLATMGSVECIHEEALMDIVTAISGSGPAYFFLFAEIMTAIAVDEGVPQEVAQRLVHKTMSGSAGLLAKRVDQARDLRLEVTSPGGTTEAALDILNSDTGFPSLLRNAISNAVKRSQEIDGD